MNEFIAGTQLKLESLKENRVTNIQCQKKIEYLKPILKHFFFLLFLSINVNISAQEISATITSESVLVKHFEYKKLSPFQKSLIDEFIEYEFPVGTKISDALTDYASLRNKTRLAELLLFRNKPGDKENAIFIFKWILKYQYKDESSENYGIWRTSVLKDRFDKNWREFIGCDLIIIYHKYRSILPLDIVSEIEAGLTHAALGAFNRDVDPSYSNISIMSSFLMEYVGNEFKIEKLRNAGLQKARDVFSLYKTHNTFSEYNSPTYYGVTLVAIALWRELAFSSEMKEMGKMLENDLWNEVAIFYNPTLKNMVGPYFRGYGMDMQKYYSIIGIWMAIAMDEESLSPMPQNYGEKYGEMSNIAPIFHLGLAISKTNLFQLEKFSSARYITRIVPNDYPGDKLKQVTVMINENWMMGGLWGNRKPWGQIKTGTIHWMNSKGDIEWLLVPGDGKTNVRVDEKQMSIYLSDQKAKTFIMVIYSKDNSPENFMKNNWFLPPMQLDVKTALKRKNISVLSPEERKKMSESVAYYPYLSKVVFEIPDDWDMSDPLISFTPKYKSQ